MSDNSNLKSLEVLFYYFVVVVIVNVFLLTVVHSGLFLCEFCNLGFCSVIWLIFTFRNTGGLVEVVCL